MKTINVNVETEVKNNVEIGAIFITPNTVYCLDSDIQAISEMLRNAYSGLTEDNLNALIESKVAPLRELIIERASLIKKYLGIDIENPEKEYWISIEKHNSKNDFTEGMSGLSRLGKELFPNMIPLSLAEKMQEGVAVDFGKFKLIPRQSGYKHNAYGTWQEYLKNLKKIINK